MSGEASEAASAAEARALRSEALPEVDAPDLPYRPPGPRNWRPRIGVVGAGGIVPAHLDAYRTAGWEVAAISNRTRAKAEALAAEYAPGARVEGDWAAILADPSIDVVDVTLHPGDRLPVLEAAIRAGKHTLSQKPFVSDLDAGERLVAMAVDRGVKLAVNQNGRWAPHMAWMRAAVRAGLLGDVLSVHAGVHWDHNWVGGTAFDAMEDLILHDFGIHWFDFVASLIGPAAETVFATRTRAVGQAAAAPLLGQALVGSHGGQASLVFDGAVRHGPHCTSFVGGTRGSVRSEGPGINEQAVTLSTERGVARPALEGAWLNDGLRGAMGELLSAIEDDRTPENDARANLASLALAFAAVASSREGHAVAVGSIRRVPS